MAHGRADDAGEHAGAKTLELPVEACLEAAKPSAFARIRAQRMAEMPGQDEETFEQAREQHGDDDKGNR